jgi:tRNA (cytidine/uridine-2'-O-)-methyltransferase
MKDHALHIVLVAPEIHWNTGNVGRTCLAVGAKLHLIEPLGFSLDDRQVRRAGLDYWPRVAPVVWSSWDAFEAELPALGTPFLFSAEAPRTYVEARYPKRCAVVFGCESTGLPPVLRERHAAALLRIPVCDPGVRSLNLSTAAAVAAYEVLRQRRAGEGQAGVGYADTAKAPPLQERR